MARPGVTYHDIANAANVLKGQGKNITIENVRAYLGTGSIGTIHNHLRKWKEIENATHKIAVKENIPDELIGLVKGLWERILTQASEQFTPIEENLRQELANLKQDLEKYKNNNQRWQKLFHQWQQEKTALVNEKLNFQQTFASLQKDHTSLQLQQNALTEQLQEKQDRIAELNRLHKQTQDNLEHYRNSVREQRILDQQQFDQQKQQLQLEIKTYQDQSILMREKFSALQHSATELEKKEQLLLSELKNHKDTVVQLEKIKTEYQLFQSQFKELQQTIHDKNNQLVILETQSNITASKLTDLQQAHSVLQDQNTLLAHDKWILVQEKAQLEGQLKQMQKIAKKVEA